MLRKLTSKLPVAFVVQRLWIPVQIGWNTRHSIENRLSSWPKLGDILIDWIEVLYVVPGGVLFCPLLG
jgi:hypothetical protein